MSEDSEKWEGWLRVYCDLPDPQWRGWSQNGRGIWKTRAQQILKHDLIMGNGLGENLNESRICRRCIMLLRGLYLLPSSWVHSWFDSIIHQRLLSTGSFTSFLPINGVERRLEEGTARRDEMTTRLVSEPGSFNSEEPENVVKETQCLRHGIESVLGGDDYSQTHVNKWTGAIMERCLTQLVKLNKPYKYICTQRTSQSPQHPASVLTGHRCFHRLLRAKWGRDRMQGEEEKGGLLQGEREQNDTAVRRTVGHSQHKEAVVIPAKLSSINLLCIIPVTTAALGGECIPVKSIYLHPLTASLSCPRLPSLLTTTRHKVVGRCQALLLSVSPARSVEPGRPHHIIPPPSPTPRLAALLAAELCALSLRQMIPGAARRGAVEPSPSLSQRSRPIGRRWEHEAEGLSRNNKSTGVSLQLREESGWRQLLATEKQGADRMERIATSTSSKSDIKAQNKPGVSGSLPKSSSWWSERELDGGAVRVPALGLGSLPEENLEWILLQICINSTATAPCGESHHHENISTVSVPENPGSIPEVVGIVALSSGVFTSWFYVV
ncbi:hypothetical protein CCH79_00006092 [Gambusia affinis]|uniref:Uncharacterized protein n=1 Tax=Gambusia affinis TaxID=33528 RepID=A0A315VL83_GAMAF|nr:hypothetical protein CCH79_00006092 [Gambusia affinis]